MWNDEDRGTVPLEATAPDALTSLDKALDEATAKQWTIVDMARDWKRVFPFM